MIPVVVRHLAETDVKKARDWYASDDQQRGARFAEEFALTVDRISSLPDQFPEVGKACDVRCSAIFHMPRTLFAERPLRQGRRCLIGAGLTKQQPRLRRRRLGLRVGVKLKS